MDALRLLVLFGVVLWMIPVAWPVGEYASGQPVPMSSALFYVFGVWGVLIVVAFFLARGLNDPRVEKDDDAEDPR